jgi:mono/diheme cytochrome c family protein
MHMRMLWAGAAAVVALSGCDRMEWEAPEAEGEVEMEAAALDPALAGHLPAGVSLEVAERGREIFPTCGVCHGMEGEGTQLGPALSDGEWIHISGTIDEIARITRSGVQSPQRFPIPMPVLGGGSLDEADLEAVATYVYLLSRSGSPADTAARSDSLGHR